MEVASLVLRCIQRLLRVYRHVLAVPSCVLNFAGKALLSQSCQDNYIIYNLFLMSLIVEQLARGLPTHTRAGKH